MRVIADGVRFDEIALREGDIGAEDGKHKAAFWEQGNWFEEWDAVEDGGGEPE